MEGLGRSSGGMVSLLMVLVLVAGNIINGWGAKVVESSAAATAAAAVAALGGGGGGEICGISVDELLTCKPAVEAPDSVPPEECCKALEKVKPPSCLCQYQNYLPVFGIDKNVAMHLPQRCKLDNAKSFHC